MTIGNWVQFMGIVLYRIQMPVCCIKSKTLITRVSSYISPIGNIMYRSVVWCIMKINNKLY